VLLAAAARARSGRSGSLSGFWGGSAPGRGAVPGQASARPCHWNRTTSRQRWMALRIAPALRVWPDPKPHRFLAWRSEGRLALITGPPGKASLCRLRRQAPGHIAASQAKRLVQAAEPGEQCSRCTCACDSTAHEAFLLRLKVPTSDFDAFPARVILRCPNKRAVSDYFQREYYHERI